MGDPNKVGQTSRPGTCAALYSQYSSRLTCPIGLTSSLFSQLAGKIIKRHSSKENELYLFIGGIPVPSGGLATVRDAVNTVRRFGVQLRVFLVYANSRYARPIGRRQSDKLADLFSPPRSAESIHSKWQSEAVRAAGGPG